MIGGFSFKQPLAGSRLGRGLVWGWLAVLLLLPIHGTLSVLLGSNLGSYLVWRSWKEGLTLLLLATALIYLTRSDPKLLRQLASRRINQLIAIYVLLHLLLAAIFGPNLEAILYGLVYNLRFLGLFFLAQVIGHYWVSKEANNRALNRLVLIPAAAVIGFGMLQLLVLPADWLKHLGYGPDNIEPFTTIDAKSDWVRISSLTRGANQLGQYLILPLVLMGGLWLKQRSLWLILGMAAGLGVMIGSYSRSAWLGLAVAAGSYLALSATRFSLKKLLWPALAVLVLLAGLIWAAPRSQSIRLIIFHDDQAASDVISSDEVRLSHTKRAIEATADNPLGGGPGAAGPASFHNDQQTRINDNYYLQLALEVGLAGLAVFVWICWLAAKSLWQQRRLMWPRVLLASFIGLALVNLFLPAWANEETALIWWGLAGLWYKP